MKQRDKDNRPRDVRKQQKAVRGRKCECGHRGGHYASAHMGPNGEGFCARCGEKKCKRFKAA